MSISAVAPQISVILPTHQGDAWITQCLDSLAAQTLSWEAFEVVVVANGPRTRTPELVDEWLAEHPGFRLQLVESEVPGVSRARNLGLDVATGTYATFVDDDDLVAPRMLEVLLAAAGPDVIPVGAVGFIDERAAAEVDFDNWYTSELLQFVGRPATSADLYVALTLVCAKLVPLDLAREVRFREDLAIAEDRVFWAELLASRSLRVALAPLAPEAAYLYWVRGDSALRRDDNLSWDGTVVPWLAVVRRFVELAGSGRELEEIRHRALASSLGNFIRGYLARHPEEIHRVDAELTALGLIDDPIVTLAHRILAREMVFVGALPDRDAAGRPTIERLAERGTLVDVAMYVPAGSEKIDDRLEPALAVLDRQVAATGPEQPTWSTLSGFLEHVNNRLEEDAMYKPGPYRAVRSVSAAPFEHALAAFFALERPGIRWTAEYVARSARTQAVGTSTAVVAEDRVHRLGHALAQAGFPLTHLPATLGELSDLAALALADALVFDTAAQAEEVIGRCPVPAIAARARSVMTLRQPASTDPVLSVVVHAHDDEGTLEACLASLARQSLAPGRYEVLVEKGADVAQARNRGLEAARGTYVTFVDGRDEVAPRFLEQLLAKATPSTIGVLATGLVRDGDLPDVDAPDLDHRLTAPLMRHAGRAAGNCDLVAAALSVTAKVLPTAVAKQTRFAEGLGLGTDPEFWTRVLAGADLQLVLGELAADAAYLHHVRPALLDPTAPLSWDVHVEAHLDAITAVSAVPTDAVAARMFQEDLVAQLYGVLREYTRAHPEDLERVDEAVAARGFTDVPWQVLHEGAATCFAVLGPQAAAARTLVERGGYADVLVFHRPDSDLAALLGPAERSIDHLAAVQVGETAIDINAAASEALAALRGVVDATGKAHGLLLSCSADPLEHLAVALIKLGLPDVPWHAEFLPAEGVPTPLVVDAEVRQLLQSGLAAAGMTDVELPQDAAALATTVAATLAETVNGTLQPSTQAGPTVVAVMGSCITRDNFNSQFNPGYRAWFDCALHQNQTSLISLMDRPIEAPWSPTVEFSDYDRWNVATELNKSFLREVVELSPRLLILDFFAEVHFGVVRLASGEYVTDNRWKVRQTDLYQRWQAEDGFSRVTWEDDKDAYLALWKGAFDQFVTYVRAHLPDTTLVLHRGHNINILELPNGDRAALDVARSVAPLDVEAANAFWSELDDYAAPHVDAVVDLRDREYVTFDAHPWKAFYVHYSMDYYPRFLQELIKVAQALAEPPALEVAAG